MIKIFHNNQLAAEESQNKQAYIKPGPPVSWEVTLFMK